MVGGKKNGQNNSCHDDRMLPIQNNNTPVLLLVVNVGKFGTERLIGEAMDINNISQHLMVSQGILMKEA